jgi:hypothetical protein
MDIYSRVLPGMGADAARKVGDALKVRMTKSRKDDVAADR